ncbi:hypothetical protein CC1G_13526 [Coprinopsis cinerea okayama7|uniref:Uncharacterized protein n=1 Tax=Coprinopsis cinerea (strain Okayama-7 / 130 / ATCC MYA-4618 / FGSC 9003) TaxID=240176 RepID=A8PJ60_COPC7|nr:hypothetical protein CC1G_13526 [Coprinopsis cinerea okayama7\|eukprot:XP_001841670.1 hypothetical protein CC1G_13526 [Coprinopsis cinerea okayama7\
MRCSWNTGHIRAHHILSDPAARLTPVQRASQSILTAFSSLLLPGSVQEISQRPLSECGVPGTPTAYRGLNQPPHLGIAVFQEHRVRRSLPPASECGAPGTPPTVVSATGLRGRQFPGTPRTETLTTDLRMLCSRNAAYRGL